MGANKITGLANGTAATDAAAFGQIPAASGLLALLQYAPASEETVTVTTLAAFDTTNLTLAFTAPASGHVLVRLTGAVRNVGGSGYFALLDHTSHAQVGNTAFLQQGLGGTTETISVVIAVTGLTGGTSYQYDWAGIGVSAYTDMFCQGAQGTPGTAYTGPATMEIWAAP